jgi:putative drug exporter of the RND superfamily
MPSRDPRPSALRRKEASAGPEGAFLGRLGPFLTRRSRLVVGIWMALVVVLAFAGRDFGLAAKPHEMLVAGSPSMRAHEIAERRFNSEEVLILMLRGPHVAVERQGRRLSRSLDRIPDATVLSPWLGGGTIRGLAPRPGVAALILRLGEQEELLTAVLPPVEERLDAVVKGPVKASVAGLPKIVKSGQEATEHATMVGEAIAVPVLLIVLLLVFRSVIAAAVPVVSGGSVVVACQGVLALMSRLVQIDSFALGVVSMLGLALGVDYSLLVVSRYREEREKRDAGDAARATISAAARSILPAGSGLVLAGVVVLELNPSALVSSVGIAVVVVTAFSVIAALCVVPAMLMLLGDRLDRLALPATKRRRVAVIPWLRGLSRRRPVVIAITLVLAVLAALAPTLSSNLTTGKLLPSGDPGRQEQEAIESSIGPGWVAPFEVLVDGNGQPVTTRQRLDAMVAFQRHAERIPEVKTVAGFGELKGGIDGLTHLERQLEKEESGLVRLDNGIRTAQGGAGRNTRGLQRAAAGAQRLARGLGAGLLAEGMQGVRTGSQQLAVGLGRADEGSADVGNASSRASTGVSRLSEGLRRERKGVSQMRSTNRLIRRATEEGEASARELEGLATGAEAQLAKAWGALERMTDGRGDPEYASAVAAVRLAIEQLAGTGPEGEDAVSSSADGIRSRAADVSGQLDVAGYLAGKQGEVGKRTGEGIDKLLEGAGTLQRGLARLSDGTERLTGAVSRLATGSSRLSPAMGRLARGTEHLQGALERLGVGGRALAGGLSNGSRQSTRLTAGLRKMSRRLSRGNGSSQLDRVRRRSPGLFRSGYFVLAGFDGARERRREPLGFLVDLDEGGVGARMLVVPRFGLADPQSGETRERLQEDADSLARATGMEVAIGGLASSELDIDRAYRERIPLTRLALAAVTALVLLFVIRSLTMALIAALLNLLTLAATFGLVALLFNGSLLGGPGYVDTVAVLATMMLTFGLAADYEVFIFARMREEYVRTGDPHQAVDNGLARVAPVVTGAAVIMITVFLAFSVSSFISIRDLGVAQAIGIFIDAFIVRLILVPAIMHALGKRAWWMPRWLDRIVPGRSTRTLLGHDA